MANLDEQNFERILNIVTPFMMGELEEILPFANLSDERREETIKLAVKASEVTLVVMEKLLNADSLNSEKLDKVENLINEGKIDAAVELINN